MGGFFMLLAGRPWLTLERHSEGIGMRLHKRMTAISALVPLLGIVVTPELLLSQQADRFAAVAPRMQEFVDKGEIAGVVTLIATRDRILHLAHLLQFATQSGGNLLIPHKAMPPAAKS